MKKHHVAALLLTCVAPSLSVAADVGFYFGLEGGRGRTQLELENDDLVLTRGVLLDASSDREDETFGIYGGYTFAKHFAIELAYADLGKTSFATVRDVLFLPIPFPGGSPTINPVLTVGTLPAFGFVAAVAAVPEQQRTTFESEALSLSLLGRYELAAGFSLIGRAAIAIHRMESELRVWLNGQPIRVIGGDDKASAGAGVLGLGLEWSFHPNWAVRLQAQRHFLLEEEEVNLIDRGDVTTATGGVEYRF